MGWMTGELEADCISTSSRLHPAF